MLRMRAGILKNQPWFYVVNMLLDEVLNRA